MLENLFESCGYLATFLGALLEGEFLLLTAVVSSKLGYFNLYGAMVAGFAGAYVADYFKFVVAKTQGQYVLKKRPKLKEKIDKHTDWFCKAPYLILIFYRFFFGFTTATILMAGLKNISYGVFGLLSAISIALWVIVLSSFGYFCADAMIQKLEFIGMHKLELVGILSTIGILYWFFVKRPQNKYCYGCPKHERGQETNVI